MNRFPWIIFDLDGTLTRTNELIYATFNHVTSKYLNRTYQPAEITTFFGPPEDVAIERLLGPESVAAAMDDFYAFYQTHHASMATEYDGIRNLLEKLLSNGVKMAVFTGKGRRSADITLDAIGCTRFFELVITGHDVNEYKPSPDGIRRIMKHFGAQPAGTLMVGDSVADVSAARSAGIPVAAVLWDSYGREKVLKMDVEHVFHSVDEFTRFVLPSSPPDPKGMR